MDESNHKAQLTVSAPGRICLFGEHQDYLGLPVIPAAIDLRITITGDERPDKIFNIQLPDINSEDEFSFDGDIPYVLERDYLRSVVNVLNRDGVIFEHGYNCMVRGDIPINSGTASSSALCVAWVKFLLCVANDPRKDEPEVVAYLAYLAEVEEFGEYWEAAKRVALAAIKVLDAFTVNFFTMGFGEMAVEHAHIHVLPRFENDGHPELPDRTKIKKMTKEQLTEIMNRIKSAIGEIQIQPKEEPKVEEPKEEVKETKRSKEDVYWMKREMELG